MQHSEAEQVKLGSPIHLALDELQTVDLPLRLPIAPGHGQSSPDSRFIALNPAHELFQGCTVALEDLLHPIAQANIPFLTLFLTHHRCESPELFNRRP